MKNKALYKKILDSRAKKNEHLIHASLDMEVSTHFPALMWSMRITENSAWPVAELGGGLFSTPLLHWTNFDSGRPVFTYESYKHYYDFEKKFETINHKIVFVKDWDTQEYLKRYGVVFIDHSIPGRKHTRGDDAIKFKDIADLVVLHDAGVDSNPKYGYENAYKHFKYRKDWPNCQTTILSNSIKL